MEFLPAYILFKLSQGTVNITKESLHYFHQEWPSSNCPSVTNSNLFSSVTTVMKSFWRHSYKVSRDFEEQTSELETAASDPERRLQDDHRRREAARRQQLLPDHRDHHERARVQFHVLQGVKQRRKLVWFKQNKTHNKTKFSLHKKKWTSNLISSIVSG